MSEPLELFIGTLETAEPVVGCFKTLTAVIFVDMNHMVGLFSTEKIRLDLLDFVFF